MKLSKFRRFIISLSYLIIILTSALFHPKISSDLLFKIIGGAIFIVTLFYSIRIHSTFPKRHESAYDFDKVMKDGPYAVCRHPFYLCLILNQASIVIFFHSVIGGISFALFLIGWRKLIIEEEKELLERFGEEYEKYMKEVPRIIPRIRRKIK